MVGGEAALRAICDAATEGIVVHRKGLILSANAAAGAMFGCSAEALIGRSIFEFGPPESQAIVRAHVEADSEAPYEATARRADGTPFLVEIRGRSVIYGTERLRAAVMRDLAVYEEMRRDRAASATLLRTVLELTADGMLAVSNAGKIILYNERFRQIWHLPQEILARADNEEALRFVEHQIVDAPLFRAKVADLLTKPEEEEITHVELRDGRIIERYSRPLHQGSETIGRVISFRDVTQARRAADELERAVRMRDDFLGVASHELYTPITSLAVALRGLRGLVPPSPSSDRLLGTLDRQVVRLAKLVQELLDVTRIDGERLVLTRSTFDLREVVRDALERFAAELDRDRIVVTVEADEPLLGSWDRSRLDQVLTNLLGNAIRFGEGKPIALTARSTPEGAVVVVQDHGIGIAPDEQARIFERFHRAASPRHFGGLGLGLFIATQIVEAHGGQLRVASAPGQGAAFTMSLPWVDRAPR
jgi:PAS domain S-box-containing protein